MAVMKIAHCGYQADLFAFTAEHEAEILKFLRIIDCFHFSDSDVLLNGLKSS